MIHVEPDYADLSSSVNALAGNVDLIDKGSSDQFTTEFVGNSEVKLVSSSAPVGKYVMNAYPTVVDRNGRLFQMSQHCTMDVEMLNMAPAASFTVDGTDADAITHECKDEKTKVVLDASSSKDPDGHSLTYTWYDNGTEMKEWQGATPITALPRGDHAISLMVCDPLPGGRSLLQDRSKCDTTKQVLVSIQDKTVRLSSRHLVEFGAFIPLLVH